MICQAYLLSETDARPCVEWEEDERVGREVLVQPLVNEPIRVKVQRCEACQAARASTNWRERVYRLGPSSLFGDASRIQSMRYLIVMSAREPRSVSEVVPNILRNEDAGLRGIRIGNSSIAVRDAVHSTHCEPQSDTRKTHATDRTLNGLHWNAVSVILRRRKDDYEHIHNRVKAQSFYGQSQ